MKTLNYLSSSSEPFSLGRSRMLLLNSLAGASGASAGFYMLGYLFDFAERFIVIINVSGVIGFAILIVAMARVRSVGPPRVGCFLIAVLFLWGRLWLAAGEISYKSFEAPLSLARGIFGFNPWIWVQLLPVTLLAVLTSIVVWLNALVIVDKYRKMNRG